MNEKSELAVFDGYNKQKIEVMFQEEANLEVKMPLFYVNSGKKEIENYVENNCKPELARYTFSRQEELNASVDGVYKPELKSYTESRKEDILYYVENTSKPKIDDYIDAEVAPYSTSAQSAAAVALASEQATKISEDKAKESELSAAASAAEAKQYRDEAEEIIHPTQATEDDLGLAAIATEEDVAAGVNDSKFITPLKAAGYYQSKTEANSKYENIQEVLAQKANKTEIFSAGNIGDIKYTSRVDVPAGGVWCDGAEYTKATFPDVYQMLLDGNLQNTDYATYNNSVSTNGSCGFFALDASNEKFKVPTLSNVYIKAGQTPLMFGVESLPNITGSFTLQNDMFFTGTGVFSTSGNLTRYVAGINAGNSGANGESFDASRSSPIYQNGAKVNPDHVVYRAYVVLYASAAEASEAQIAEFLTTMDSKANADMSNVDPEWASSAGKPSDRFDDLQLQAIGTEYTAPANGWFVLKMASSAGGQFVYGECEDNGCFSITWSYGSGNMLSAILPIKKGKKAIFKYTAQTQQFFRFIYDEGAK